MALLYIIIYFAQKISWIVNWFGEDHFYLSLVHNSFPAYSTHDFHRGRGKMGGSSRVRVKSIGFVGQTGCGSIGSRVELTHIFQTSFFF